MSAEPLEALVAFAGAMAASYCDIWQTAGMVQECVEYTSLLVVEVSCLIVRVDESRETGKPEMVASISPTAFQGREAEQVVRVSEWL
jgi:hypothetical protein